MKTYKPRYSSPLASSARHHDQPAQAPDGAAIEHKREPGPLARRFRTLDRNDPLGSREKRHLRSFLQSTLAIRYTAPLRTSILVNTHDRGEQLKCGLLRDHLALRIYSPNRLFFVSVEPWRGDAQMTLPPATSEAALRVNLSLLQEQARLVRSAVISGRSLLPPLCPTLPRVNQLRDSLVTIEQELYIAPANDSSSVLSSKVRLARLMQEVWRHNGCLLALPGSEDPVFLLPDVKQFYDFICAEAAHAHAQLHDAKIG